MRTRRPNRLALFLTVPLLPLMLIAASTNPAAARQVPQKAMSAHARTFTAIPPDAISRIFRTPGDGTMGLSWYEPYDGGSPILGYDITVSPGDRHLYVTSTDVTIDGLTNGVEYRFGVTTRNAVGTSTEFSEWGTPYGRPKQPASPSVTVLPGGARISWTPPDDNGAPITNYAIHVMPGNKLIFVPGYLTTTTIEPGPPGFYQYDVAGDNAAGVGVASTPSAPILMPGDPGPVKPKISVKKGKIVLTWKAPVHDSPIVRYHLRMFPGGTRVLSGSTRKVTIKTKKGRKYYFAISADTIYRGGEYHVTKKVKAK